MFFFRVNTLFMASLGFPFECASPAKVHAKTRAIMGVEPICRYRQPQNLNFHVCVNTPLGSVRRYDAPDSNWVELFSIYSMYRTDGYVCCSSSELLHVCGREDADASSELALPPTVFLLVVNVDGVSCELNTIKIIVSFSYKRRTQ